MKENWRAWQRSLQEKRVSLRSANWEGLHIREISRCFLVLGLLFIQISCQGDDLSVDLLLARWAFTVCCAHCLKCWLAVRYVGVESRWGSEVVVQQSLVNTQPDNTFPGRSSVGGSLLAKDWMISERWSRRSVAWDRSERGHTTAFEGGRQAEEYKPCIFRGREQTLLWY